VSTKLGPSFTDVCLSEFSDENHSLDFFRLVSPRIPVLLEIQGCLHKKYGSTNTDGYWFESVSLVQGFALSIRLVGRTRSNVDSCISHHHLRS
jgi:hypothetical protein